VIACVYCGGAHERPADIRQCWADHEQPALPLDAAGDTGTDSVPSPTAPTGVVRSPSTDRVERQHAARRRSAEPIVVGNQVVVPLRRGPISLGRNVIVSPGQPAPADWASCGRSVLDRATLADPTALVEALRTAAIAATGHVIELAVDFETAPESVDRHHPHELGAAYTFLLDELHHLVWSNAVDAREPDVARFGAIDLAVARGAAVCDADSPGDIVDPSGTAVWLDAGPIRHSDPIDGVPVLHAVQVEHGAWRTPLPNVSDAALAPDQLAAVTHPGGPARIIAPAGSGKTRVLTERARHLLGTWLLPSGAVSLVAFNKRAQEEMRERTADLPGLQVRTLNAIALAIVNGTAPFAPQQRSWRTIDEPDVRRILQRFVTVPRRRNTDPIAPWIDALSLVRLGLVDPTEVEVRYGGDVDGLVDVYPQYVAALERDGLVDFDGQISRAIQVLLTQPAARRAAQRASRVLLVDEFQDLTPAHLLLVRLLAAPGGAVFGVGDDDQTIYGYNGADPGWLIDFARWFPGAGDHPLEVNYRCPGGIVEIADRLVRHNRRRVDKVIRAASAEPDGWSVTSSDDPVGATLSAVRSALDRGGVPADVAVLTRVNATIAPVQVALTAAGVPIAGGVGTEFADRTAIRAALAWLRLARGAPFSPDDLAEAMRRPSRPLHPRIADWVGEQRDVDALLRLADRLTNERDATRVNEFAGDIARLQAMVAAGTGTSRLFDVLLDDIGLGGAVATLDNSRRGMNRSAQGDDLIALRQLARQHTDVATFDSWLREQLATRRAPGGVMLATVHRVKGQEWPHVVVHLADVDQYPHRLADDPEEERRLFHVAITRASSHATIVSGEYPSSFVSELTTEPAAHVPVPDTPTRASSVPTRRRPESPDHPLLDRGRVIAVPGLVLVDQGHEWVITRIEPEAAIAERNGTTRRFGIGAKVETLGRQRGRLGARPGDVDEASARLFDSLRGFRDRARQGKPAYTVFDDKTLAAIASALPIDLDQLARVKGVGPAKLEQYGDDVLMLVADAIDS
jgi:DNA helicase-2/ATP-dependent DNA helicase PcrA